MAMVRRYRATEPAHLEPIEWWLQDAYFFPERTFIREGWLFRYYPFHSPADSGFCVHVSRLDVQLEATDEVAYYREHGEGRWLEAESVGPAVD